MLCRYISGVPPILTKAAKKRAKSQEKMWGSVIQAFVYNGVPSQNWLPCNLQNPLAADLGSESFEMVAAAGDAAEQVRALISRS